MKKLERYLPDKQMGVIVRNPLGRRASIAEAAEQLRPIRLHHWRQVLRYSELREEAERAGAKDVIKRVRKFHAMHLGYVQQLNEFFEPGDTAENDDKGGDAT